MKKLEVFKTIKLGSILKTAFDFENVFSDFGYSMDELTKSMMTQFNFTVSTERKEVDLVIVTAAQIGFEGKASLRDLWAKAKTLGLQLCPAEVGPMLRFQYPKQPEGEWLRIAMQPLPDSNGDLRFFVVASGSSGPIFTSCYGGPEEFFSSKFQWVFIQPRES